MTHRLVEDGGRDGRVAVVGRDSNENVKMVPSRVAPPREATAVSQSTVAKKRIVFAVLDYDLSISSPIDADTELQGFERIAESMIDDCPPGSLYAAVQLWDEAGHVTLASCIAHVSSDSIFVDGSVLSKRRLVPIHQSLCHSILLNNPQPFVTKLLRQGSAFNPLPQDVVFVGYVLYNKDAIGVGMLSLLWNASDESTLPIEIESTLSKLAKETMQQLELRRVLLTKNRAVIQMLKKQNSVLQLQLADPEATNRSRNSNVVLPSFGPVHEVTTFDLCRHTPPRFQLQRKDTMSTLATVKSSSSSVDSAPRQPQRTAALPMFHQADQIANAEQRAHLPDDYFAVSDAMGIDHTPVHKDDMQRVAALEGMELHEIQPNDPVGIELKRITVRPSLSCALAHIHHKVTGQNSQVRSFSGRIWRLDCLIVTMPRSPF
jgi:hypothetical protein